VSSGSRDLLRERAGVSADELRDLLSLVGDTDVTELDVTLGSTRLTLRRAPAQTSLSAVPAEEPREPRSLAIASPLVGIFRPSVASGDALEAGQSIGAIEALGMPTSVDAPQSGTVEDLLVQDGSPVEYGQPLLILRRGDAS
jgi:acetyl-CoA carboxylase biotin carboxyl carrier protein